MREQRHLFQLGPFRIVIIYAAVSFLWIYFSDTLLGLFVRDPQLITTISLFKGLAFIFITAILLYLFIRRDVLINRQLNDALKSSERRFEQLLENSFDNIVVLDAQGIQRYVSKSVTRTLGYQPSELLNISVIDEMIHPDDQAKLKESFFKIVADGQGGGIQYRHRHKNGEWVDLEAWGTNQLNNPDIEGIVVNCRVITESKQAELDLQASEEKYRSLFNNAEVGMFRSRFDGSEILELNDKYLSILGKTREELIGKPSSILWVDLKEREEMLKILKDKGRVNAFECRLLNKAGGVVNFLTSLRFYSETGIVEGSIIDITERKQAQEALKLAKEQAEAANKFKTEFLMNISHDLRTPLHAILGFANTLQSVNMEAKYRKGVDYINERAKHLLTMVEEILSVSKMESGKLELKSEEFDFYKLLENSIEVSRVGLRKKEVGLSLEVKGTIPRLKGDALRVRQIIDNLLTNAVKYTQQGEIKVMAGLDEQQDLQDKYSLKVSVKDTGFGIPAEKLPYIFESFTRFHESYGGKLYEGVGLGLHIVKGLTSLMGGEIRVFSEVGKGSEFIVTFNFDKV